MSKFTTAPLMRFIGEQREKNSELTAEEVAMIVEAWEACTLDFCEQKVSPLMEALKFYADGGNDNGRLAREARVELMMKR